MEMARIYLNNQQATQEVIDIIYYEEELKDIEEMLDREIDIRISSMKKENDFEFKIMMVIGFLAICTAILNH